MQYLHYSHQSINGSDKREVVAALSSDFITQGPRIKEFEEKLCGYTGAKYAVLAANGTAALHIACLSAEIKAGDEVITSSVTFLASANCALYCLAKPVFADIQIDTLNIDPDQIRRKINKRTKAIIPVDFAGCPCDLEKIHSIARRNNCLVIEDAAHALGAEYKGTRIGSAKFSDMVVFSFHPVKTITTAEGGAVLTNSKKLYEKLLIFRNHGIVREEPKWKDKKMKGCGWYYEMQYLGFNYRISDIQAALGISQLNRIDKFINRRREIVRIYNQELSDLKGIILPREEPHVRSAWHIYCIRLNEFNKRKEAFSKLKKAGIGTQVHYIPVYKHPYYRGLFGNQEKYFPNAELYYKQTLSLPIYPDLKDSQIAYVARTLKKIIK